MKKEGCFVFLLALTVHCGHAADNTANAEIIARIFPPTPDPSGIAVNSQNRVFVGFPRHSDDHNQPVLEELKNGQLSPYPGVNINKKHEGNFSAWLVSPHGMWVDKNDTLWVIDDGKMSGNAHIPEGAAKIVGIDTRSNKVTHVVNLVKPVLRDDAHYNDIRVDLKHGQAGTAYISNSGFAQRYSLIVVDIATGKQREVLVNHYSTSPDPGYMAFLEYKPHTFDAARQTMPSGGVDGLALGKNDDKLFWTALSGRALYSISTRVVSDFTNSEQAIENSVHFEGQHPPNDGLAEDNQGNIFFGAYEQQSLVSRSENGKYSLLLHDATNLGWPDGLAFSNNALYVTLGQWNRTADLNQGHDLRQYPYLIMRVRTDAPR